MITRREFIESVGGCVAVACLPLPALGPIAAVPMTATEVGVRCSAFEEQFMAEFVRQYEQQGILSDLVAYGRSTVKVLKTPDQPWFSLESVSQ